MNSTTTNATAAFDSGGQGETICDIFTWVDVGLMAGLWLVMLIFQGYLILICQWYSSSQLADHSKYYSIYSVTAPEGITLGERQQDAWDPRPSTDSWAGSTPYGVAANARPGYGNHSRQNSDATERAYGVGAADVGEKGPTYGYKDEVPRRQLSEGMTEAYVSHPDDAYTYSTQPTPVAAISPDRRYAGSNIASLPPGAVPPNEGQFGRKTPRTGSVDYNQPGYSQANARYAESVTSGYAPTAAPTYYTHQQQPY